MNKQDRLYNLITKRRTIRRFKQKSVRLSAIKMAVGAARLAPSAANLQFIEYLAVTNPNLCRQVFTHTRWGGYVSPRRIPGPDQQPAAYIVILINRKKSPNPDLRDIGAAAENILLALLSLGIGTCWIASLDRPKLGRLLKITKKYTG